MQTNAAIRWRIGAKRIKEKFMVLLRTAIEALIVKNETVSRLKLSQVSRPCHDIKKEGTHASPQTFPPRRENRYEPEPNSYFSTIMRVRISRCSAWQKWVQ